MSAKFKVNDRIKELDEEDTLGAATVIRVEDDHIVVQFDDDNEEGKIPAEDQDKYELYPYPKEPGSPEE